MTVSSKHINDLPTELICDILNLLPVRERIRLSVVCKQWDAIVFRSKKIVLMAHTANDDLQQLIKTIQQSNRQYRRVALNSMMKHDSVEFGELCLAAAKRFGETMDSLVINGTDLHKSILAQVLTACCELKELTLDVRITQTDSETVLNFPVLPHLEVVSFATYYNKAPFYDCFQNPELVPKLTALKFRGTYPTAIPFIGNVMDQLSTLVLECDHHKTLGDLFVLRPVQLKTFSLTAKHIVIDRRVNDIVPFFSSLINLESLSITTSRMVSEIEQEIFEAICNNCSELELLRLVNPEGVAVLAVTEDLQKLKRLKGLELSGNNTKLNLMLPHLERMRVEFSTNGLEHYQKIYNTMPNLKVLEVFEDDHLNDSCLEEICSNLPELRKLVLYNCKKITSPALAILCKLQNLQELELIYDSEKKHVTIDFFQQFPAIPNKLDRLLIAGNVWMRLSGVSKVLESIPNLKVLEIASNIHVPAPRNPKTKTEIVFSKPYQRFRAECRMLREIRRL